MVLTLELRMQLLVKAILSKDVFFHFSFWHTLNCLHGCLTQYSNGTGREKWQFVAASDNSTV